jgi:hypothetical protein
MYALSNTNMLDYWTHTIIPNAELVKSKDPLMYHKLYYLPTELLHY